MSTGNEEKATTFDGSDAPSGQRLDESESLRDHYSRLSLANDPSWVGKWRDESRETKKNSTAIVDAIAGQLDLTDYQQERAHRFLAALPGRINESRPTSLVALCVCSHAAIPDGREYYPKNVQDDTPTTNEFTELVDELGFSYTRFYLCWEAVGREVD